MLKGQMARVERKARKAIRREEKVVIVYATDPQGNPIDPPNPEEIAGADEVITIRYVDWPPKD